MMSNYYRNSACSVRHVMLGVDDDGHRPVIDQSTRICAPKRPSFTGTPPERNASSNLIHMKSACSGLRP